MHHWLDRYYVSQVEVQRSLTRLAAELAEHRGGLDGVGLLEVDGADGGQASLNRLFRCVAPAVPIVDPTDGPLPPRLLYLDNYFATGQTLKRHLRTVRQVANRLVVYHVLEHALDPLKVRDEVVRRGGTWRSGRRLENGRSDVRGLDVIRPMGASATKPVEHYLRWHGQVSRRVAFAEPTLFDDGRLYVAPDDRLVVERALLRVGVGLAEGSGVPSRVLRPLGFVRPQSWSLGFGALAFTYQNAPNVLPLALWWSAGGWFPLVERRRR